jgi:NAD(P)-dependent dehydrogenase (short-subunit alcohol dehydrogenase family)
MRLMAPGHPRTAVVTGAAGAIGSGIAVQLAAAGFDLRLIDVGAANLDATCAAVESAGGAARTYSCDVTDPDAVEATVVRITSDSARLDVLVNNAGIVHVDDLLDLRFETWRQVMSVNADGTFLMSQSVARVMVGQPLHPVLERRGMIINIASAAAEVGRPTRAAYSASKAVVKNLTMTQALALSHHDVAACLVYPGEVIDGMLRSIYIDTAVAEGRQADEVIAEAESVQPTGRFQTAAEVGQRVAFLAGSTGMTHSGTLLWCDPHLTALKLEL